MSQLLYLMERKTKKEKESRGSDREIKIGISNKPNLRLNGSGQVNDSIPGKVVILATWKCEDARKLEKHLHKHFEAYNFIPKRAGKGGGKTEWFRLRNSQIRECKGLIRMHIKGGSKTNGELISITVFWSLIALVAFAFLLNFN